MSAFVVSDETMRRVVRTICTRGQYGPIVGETFAGVPTSDPSRIGRLLYTLNIEAVQQRYPDCVDNPDNMPGPCDDNGKSTALKLASSFKTAVSSSPIWPVDELVKGYKAIECLIYQCSEGDVPETALFKELDRASDRIAAAIVRKLPAYEKAKWG